MDRYGEERVLHNPWINFGDRYGRRWAQPDIILMPEEFEPLIIIECKLTYTKRDAEKQLRELYYPLARNIWGVNSKDCKLVQACKNLTRHTDRRRLVHDIRDVMDYQSRRNYQIWNWRQN